MILSGTIFAESPIYRGNSKKTLFTRNGDGKERLVSLAGRVEGTAQSLMDAFIGESKNKRNKGLINQMWERLFEEDIPSRLITNVKCSLKKSHYNSNNFFDLRMGLKLDEDRMASISGKNYKCETVFRNAEFNIDIDVDMDEFKKPGVASKLISVFNEMKDGRFWYGAGKSKGLGRCRLELEASLPELSQAPAINTKANHLTCYASFSSKEPLLIGWNWGKVDQESPAFMDVEGKYLIEGMRFLPKHIKSRLSSALGGAVADLERWKKEFFNILPKAMVSWFKTSTDSNKTMLVIAQADIQKLTKGKYPISKNILKSIQPMVDKGYEDKAALEKEFSTLLNAKEIKKNRRILELAKPVRLDQASFSDEKWYEIETSFNLDDELKLLFQEHFSSSDKLEELISKQVSLIANDLSLQIDQQLKLLNSDPWVENEIAVRQEHKKIKEMLLAREITEQQWGDFRSVPKGVSAASWREFLQSHDRIQYQHILNPKNLNKSIVNDKNVIDFLTQHKIKAHQELSQLENIDFRSGGMGGRTVSKNYGKPYDSVFMRMLSWSRKDGDSRWEIYIPGSTVKGAFRKRATQVLRALWGESRKTSDVIHALFGAQREPGLLKFSDAYPVEQEISRTVWCSMDAVQIDPRTGKPTDKAKSDYLYAYGDGLSFDIRVDLQDISVYDKELIDIFSCLLKDFRNGDIPLGSDKTSGLGWVKANIRKIDWLYADNSSIHKKLFRNQDGEKCGVWNNLILEASGANEWIDANAAISSEKGKNKINLPVVEMDEGYISHRSFGGYCGTLVLDGEVLTPLHIQESGEPSYKSSVHNKTVNGWDFFSKSSPEQSLRNNEKEYVIPSKTVRGLLRAMYSMATNSSRAGKSLSSLNEAEKLFGWVGDGSNQALMGRLSVGFAEFDSPTLSWFASPTQYGEWAFFDHEWVRDSKYSAFTHFANEWRIFPHAPIAPCVESLGSEFLPSHEDLSYMRAIMPGSQCKLKVRFWNLRRDELERLIWCATLENGLAHKLGKLKQLGMGSVRFKLSEASYLINWAEKYSSSDSDGQQLIIDSEWRNTTSIKNYIELKKFLNADAI